MTNIERLSVEQTEVKTDFPLPRRQRIGGSRKGHVTGKRKRFYEPKVDVPPLCEGYMTLPETERTYVQGRTWTI